MGVVEGVEGMKELFLRRFLASDEVDIIDKEEIEGAETGTENRSGTLLNCRYELIGEFFTRDIKDFFLGGAAFYFEGDRLHQMCFPKPDTAIDKERIVMFSGLLRDRPGGGVGEPASRPDDEIFKGVIWIETEFTSL